MEITLKCVLRETKALIRKNKKGKGYEREMNYLKKEVTLGDETFTDLTKIKARARKILSSHKDGDKIQKPDHDFILDILKYHKNFEGKTNDLDHFTTGKPDEHDYSRCFFIVRSNGDKEDFSIHKCIETISNNNKKKRKSIRKRNELS